MRPASTLVDLYALLLADGTSGPGDSGVSDAEVFQEVATRAALLRDGLAATVAGWSTPVLDDQAARLAGVLARPATVDTPGDLATREIARVQLETVRAELTRRATVAAAAAAGHRATPGRTHVLGAIMALETQARGGSQLAPLADAVRQVATSGRPGAPAVGATLRATGTPTPDEPSPVAAWVRAGVALEWLANGEPGFGGQSLILDAVTTGQAMVAKRLLYGIDRQDPRFEDVDWPLDLTPTEVADLITRKAAAEAAWIDAGHPWADWVRAQTPTRAEELGRPAPHVCVVPEDVARTAAEAAGGLSVPVVYAVHPADRVRTAKGVWLHGLPTPAPGQLGLPLYTGGGDPSVRWGAPPDVRGLRCAVIVPSEAVLRLHAADDPAADERFLALTTEAQTEARGPEEYAERLRAKLRAAGVRVIARFDHVHEPAPYPQEIIVLDPDPDVVVVVRETVPSFMHGDPPPVVPPFRRGVYSARAPR